MRTIALCVASLLLMSCNPQSEPEPVGVTRPQVCDPRVEAERNDEPTFPQAASLPQPVTESESEGMRLFLRFVSDVIEWGREGNEVADIAQQECRSR